MWQYEYPLPLWGNASNWAEVMRADVYNQVGGSVVPLHGGKTFLWGLTSMSAADGGETNEQLPISALLFELDMTSAPGAIVASAKVPIPHTEVGKQNGYRFVPWDTISGEGTDAPAGLDDTNAARR